MTTRIKRTFMLTRDQIRKLYLLKAEDQEKNLSVIVGEAIEVLYHRKNGGDDDDGG